MENYKFGQKVYVHYRGLIKEGVYKGVENDGEEKYHAVDIPSISKRHMLKDDDEVSTSKHDLLPMAQSFSQKPGTKSKNR